MGTVNEEVGKMSRLTNCLGAIAVAAAAFTVLFSATTTPTYGQITGAIIQGIVSDAQEAAIPGIEITVTNTATGVTTSTKTNGAGVYEFPVLIPGVYSMNAKAPGFSAYERTGVQLVLQQRLRVDIRLELDNVRQAIEVTGAPTLVDTETAKSSHLISGDTVRELPQNGRNSYMVTRLVPGANIAGPADGFISPIISGNAANVSLNGNAPQTNAAMVDGVPAQFGTGILGFIPSNESVQEIQVQSFALSSEYGQSSGGVITTQTKSGTNTPHGAAWWYHTDPGLQTNTFFNNKYGTAKSGVGVQQFGFNFGGPIEIPHVYNGKNRTFFFANYEGDKEAYKSVSIASVPTALERSGDFSATTTSDGKLIQVYNPFSTRYSSGSSSTLIRDPFPNNQIPASLINATATGYLKFVPLPNQPGSVNNSASSSTDFPDSYTFLARVDHHISERDSLYVSSGRLMHNEIAASQFHPSDGQYHSDSRLTSIGWIHVFSPSTILNLRAGMTIDTTSWKATTTTADRNAIGFSQQFLSTVTSADFPIINNSDMISLNNPTSLWKTYSPTVRPAFTKIAGRHSLDFGYEYRLYRFFIRDMTNEAGNFSFDRSPTQGPNASASSANAGYGVASMLLGTMSSGTVAINANTAAQTQYNALYLQDTWRATRRLTVNVGLRWDYETPVTERFNRMNRGFDFTASNPIAAAAQANYAANPIPQLASLNVLGGLVFSGVGGQPRTSSDPVRDNLMPRLGLAYQLSTKTVIRAGYGLFYDPLRVVSGTGTSEVNQPLTQTGFSSTTSVVTSLGGVPLNTFSNPVSQGLVQPAGASAGLLTLLGQSITATDPKFQRGRTNQFQFSIQRELPDQTVFEAAYVGSRSNRLQVTQSMNALPNQYLSLGDSLSNLVANPFYGLISIGSLSLPTVSRQQLLLPYPEFSSISEALRPIGSSWYNSMQLSANKRFSHNLSFLAAYTWSKNMQRLGYLNNYQPLERVISPIDRTQQFTVSGRWDIPVGKGQQFGSHLPLPLEYLIGNWEGGWIATFQAGQPLSFGSAVVTGTPQSIDPTVSKWFDTSVFTAQHAYTLRTLSSQIAQLRSDGAHNFNFTLSKTVPIRERLKFHFTTQLFNAFNSPIFRAPNTTVTSAAFGTVTRQANQPRWIEFSGKIDF
jgi:hypothetical protein